MPERTQKQKPAPQERKQEAQVEAKTGQSDDIKAITDELLDEIDGLLEENAEEFVKNYVQKGGQ